eukprot:CAMPEP_0197387962 /NCGR_PEP_ID=MMETSP1165-20131217/806_1 /TAXON_ID=284809 /ORGANISM="Chrysocystis fragilis, Strain CCMP3189" /LENGTH=369 /DNA_ID=CAMNT_0042913297 /DNA_START=24 /DNA_END=1134 /DNA_ORIENTATION=+
MRRRVAAILTMVGATSGLQATMQGGLAFSKYHGLGNDFVLVDNRESSELVIGPEIAAQVCDRNFGVGGDGVIFVLPAANGGDYAMRIINSDASEPEMCGNGIRCLARFLVDELGARGETTETGEAFKIETLGGLMVPVVRDDGSVTVDMGEPILEPEKIPTTLAATKDGAVVDADLLGHKVTCVSMGNPHCIAFVDDVDALDLAGIGPTFETDPAFPNRVNTEFVQVIDDSTLKMRVWERGAGPTLACGTGACALLVAAVLAEKVANTTCRVMLPGGDLEIEWRQADNHVYMSGPAQLVFQATSPSDLLSASRLALACLMPPTTGWGPRASCGQGPRGVATQAWRARPGPRCGLTAPACGGVTPPAVLL